VLKIYGDPSPSEALLGEGETLFSSLSPMFSTASTNSALFSGDIFLSKINTNIFHQLRRNVLEAVEDRIPLDQLDAVLAGASFRRVHLGLQPRDHVPVILPHVSSLRIVLGEPRLIIADR